MTQTIVNLGTGGAVLNGQNGSTAGADSNDALFLDWPGGNDGNYWYQVRGGSGSSGLNIPDAVALRITGDIDLRAHIALDDWTPASTAQIIAKYWVSDPHRGYILEVLTTGRIAITWSTNGFSATVVTAQSTVSVPFTDGSAGWIRATLDVDNGAGGYDATFYTSTDGVTYTQLGAVVTGGATTSIHASDRIVEFGSYSNGSGNMVGKFYRGQIYDGINGTLVADVDTSLITAGSNTSFTARTGQTVTMRRNTAGRKPVAVVSPVWLFGTDDYMEVADNALLDFGASDSFTVLAVIRQWATPTNFGNYVHKRDGTTAGFVLQSNGTNLSTSNAVAGGGVNVSRSSTTFTAGSLVTAAFVVNRTAQTIEPFINGVSNSTSSISTVASPANSLPLRIGRRADGTAYQDFELLGVLVFRRVLTAAEITAINTYYQNRAA